jgi:hypothetical protein
MFTVKDRRSYLEGPITDDERKVAVMMEEKIDAQLRAGVGAKEIRSSMHIPEELKSNSVRFHVVCDFLVGLYRVDGGWQVQHIGGGSYVFKDELRLQR